MFTAAKLDVFFLQNNRIAKYGKLCYICNHKYNNSEFFPS